MTYEVTFHVTARGTHTRIFDDLPGGRDIDSQILELMAAEFCVPRWHVVLERVRRVSAHSVAETQKGVA